MTPPDHRECVEDRFLNRVERSDRSQQQLRAALTKGDVFGRVIGDFSEAAGVKKPHHRRFRREIEHPRDAGTGPKTGTDFGRGRAGQCANDRGLAGTDLAEQPEHRRDLPGLRRDGLGIRLIRLRGDGHTPERHPGAREISGQCFEEPSHHLAKLRWDSRIEAVRVIYQGAFD
ncbi:MAG: hypothetical protein WCF85_15290 [Rhodospirillaceae bacterium]